MVEQVNMFSSQEVPSVRKQNVRISRAQPADDCPANHNPWGLGCQASVHRAECQQASNYQEPECLFVSHQNNELQQL